MKEFQLTIEEMVIIRSALIFTLASEYEDEMIEDYTGKLSKLTNKIIDITLEKEKDS